MPVTEKDIFEVLGIDSDPATIQDPAAFKELFEKSFTSKASPDEETKAKIVGMDYGSFRAKLKQVFKKHGIEPAGEEELKKKNFAQLLEYADGELEKKYTTLLEETKNQAGQAPNEKIQALESEINKWKLTAQEEKAARESALAEITQKESAWVTEKKDIQKKFIKDDIHAKEMKWASGVSDLTKRGFWADFNDKYDTDLDESGELIPMTKKGERIPHPTKTGQFLSYKEILQKEAVEQNVWEKNPHGAGSTGKKFESKAVATPGESPLNVVAPRHQIGRR